MIFSASTFRDVAPVYSNLKKPSPGKRVTVFTPCNDPRPIRVRGKVYHEVASRFTEKKSLAAETSRLQRVLTRAKAPPSIVINTSGNSRRSESFEICRRHASRSSNLAISYIKWHLSTLRYSIHIEMLAKRYETYIYIYIYTKTFPHTLFKKHRNMHANSHDGIHINIHENYWTEFVKRAFEI